MTPAEYRIRCRMSENCLPDAEYRTRLTALHDDMLKEIEALREALRFHIRTYRVDDQHWAPEEEADRLMALVLAQGEKT